MKRIGATREAGVSEVIGVVLIIGLAVTLIAVLQVSAVPIWNEAVEIDHSREVQDEMVGMREAILTTAGTGGTRSVSVKLGTGYPNRIVLRNPPASTGTLRTVGEGQVSVNNLSFGGGDSNADGYWRDVDPNIQTRALVYTPDYNEYLDAPDTGYENTVVFNQGNGEAALSDGVLVDGDVITLPVLNGTVSETGSRRVTVDLRPRSVSTDAVRVSRNGTGPHFGMPTQLSQDTWDSLLGDEQGISHDVDGGRLELTLTDEDEEYRLRMAEVSVDGSGADLAPAYITKVDALSVDERIVVEVRDKYNNPLAGAEVEASSNCERGSRTTGQEGRATFDCDRSQETVLSINGTDREGYEEVRVPDEDGAVTARPEVDSATLTKDGTRFENNSVGATQYTVDYEVLSVSDVGLRSVLITLLDANDDDDVITSASNVLNGQGSYTGRWVSPWLKNGTYEPDDVSANITVVDEAGNSNSSTVDENGGVSPDPPNGGEEEEFTSLTAEVDIQEQQDRIRRGEFSYSLGSSSTVEFSIVEFDTETVTGSSGDVTVKGSGQYDLPATLRGDIQGGECLEIEVPSGTDDGVTFDLVADGTGC